MTTDKTNITTPIEINKESATVPQNEERSTILQSLDAAIHTPTAEDVEYQEMRDAHLITTSKQYPPREFLLKVKGIPTLSLGDLHLIQAQAKQGKSSLVTIFVAAIISRQWGVLERALERGAKVIIFDTEQYESDTFHQYETIMRLSGMEHEDHSLLSMFSLRDMTYEDRRKFIHSTISRECPDLAVIDGIRDLVPDINDPTFCPQYVDELMNLATKANCAILSVLHNNPGEGKARGWLGTEYINKCGSSFEPKKEDNIVTVVNQIYRKAPVPDWQFTFQNDGTPIVDQGFINERMQHMAERKQQEVVVANALKEAEHLKVVIDALKLHAGECTRTELVGYIDSQCIAGFRKSKVQELIKAQLSKPNPPFAERDGKICLITRYTQGDLEL